MSLPLTPDRNLHGVLLSANNGSTNDFSIGVVGDGFGALLVYTAAVYMGFRPEQIGVFGKNLRPTSTYQQFAWNLGQTVLRSESESHFLPGDWPSFAQLDAWSRKDPAPLFRSAGRKFNPGVPEIMIQAETVAARLDWKDRIVGGTHVGWVVREPGPPLHFSLYDEDAQLLGRAKHLMIAVGHGPLAFPGVYGKARENPELRDWIVQAYEPKRYYQGGRYIIVGSGIASVNEWANCIEAGAQCIALRRNPHPDQQDLNVPRCLFDGSGIDAFQGLGFDERVDFLGKALKGTAPTRRNWSEIIRHGRNNGLFEEVIGNVSDIQRGPAGLKVRLNLYDGTDVGDIDLTGIVVGTGFVKSALALPLVRRLAQTYDVPIERDRVKLKLNCGVPPLDRPDSRLAMMGLASNTIVPNADTISGLKYQARRFAADCFRAEGIKSRPFGSRVRMQMSLSRDVAKGIKTLEKTEQLA